MGNLIISLKKMIINKTTVTVIGLLLCLVIVFYSYNIRVQSSIEPVTVPYAKVKIPAGTQITAKMVGLTDVPPSMLDGNVIRDVSSVIDKYTNADTIIPEGSLFYERNVVNKEELPANIILDYPTGYVLYNLPVTTESTYGNSVNPGNYIDIYLRAEKILDEKNVETNQNSQIMFGKLLSHVKVIAVRDSEGRSVLENPDEKGKPAMVIFALPEEYYLLLSRASFLRTYSSVLIPVPTNESLKEEQEDVAMPSQQLKDWINTVTVWNLN